MFFSKYTKDYRVITNDSDDVCGLQCEFNKQAAIALDTETFRKFMRVNKVKALQAGTDFAETFLIIVTITNDKLDN